MRKFLKWTGIVILCLGLIIVIASFIMINKYKKMATVEYEANPTPITTLTDSASLVRGASIAASLCSGCHGGDLAGKEFFNVPELGVVPAPNITRGGRTKDYSDVDYVKAIKYGVKPDGHGLFVMPVEDFNYMSDADLGALIGYLKSVPASDKTWADPTFTTMAQIMAGAGLFGTLYNAELVDLNNNKPIVAPEPGTDIAYGEYTLRIHGCWTCHGEKLNGNKSPDPASPPGSNITPGGNFGKWSLDQFKDAMRNGVTPENLKLDPEFMPWPSLGLMTDVEMEAVYNYLKSMPVAEDAEVVVKWKEKNK